VSESPAKPAPYQVIYSERVRNEVRRLIDLAATPDLAREILAAFKVIDQRLRVYPQFGEPLLDLHEPGQIRIGTVGPVVMRYAVYEERRLVMVVALPEVLPSTSNPEPGSDSE
jgi:hypothetical protein